MKHKVLIGFVNTKYAVWYKPYDNIMFCEPLNLLITGIFDLQTAIEKCKIFSNFEYADNVEYQII